MSLSEQVRGVLSTAMSDASCAMTLGRSKAWVVRMRHEIAIDGAPAAIAASPACPAPAEFVAPVPAAEEAPAIQVPPRSINRRCNPDAGQGAAPTAAQMAAALSFAARSLRVDPSQICMPGMSNRKVRILAGAGLRARLGTANTQLAALLGLHGPELAPSMVRAAGVTTDDLLSLSEALPATAEGDAPALALVIERRPPAVKTSRVRKAKTVRPVKLRAATPVKVPVPATVSDRPLLAAKAVAAGPLKDNLRVPTPSRPRTPTRRSPSAELMIETPRPSRTAIRFKAITSDVARWAAWFADAQWDLDEVAGLFDVHPDALVDAVAARACASLPA